MSYKYVKSLAFCSILSVTILSCRPTKILQQTQTKYYQGNTIDNVVVRALPGKLGEPELFEKRAIKNLKHKGVEFTPAYLIPEMHDSTLRTQPADLRLILMDKGYKGLIELKLVSVREETTSSKNQYPTRREYRIMDDTHYNQLIQEYGKREEKGSEYQDIKVKMDIRMYDLNQKETHVIWSARTETNNPKNNNNIANGCSGKVKKYLKSEAIYGTKE